jgi:hypothetical protein
LIRGTVINLHAFGAVVRLESGQLASAPADDVESHRVAYERAHAARAPLEFELRGGDRPLVTLLPNLHDEGLETKIGAYLKASEEIAADHHFLQKKPRPNRRTR